MRPGIILAALGLALAAFGLFSFGSASAADVPVAAGDFFFCDQSQSGQVCETTITSGDSVTWTVQAGTHTVIQCTDGTFSSCGSGFDSGVLSSGQTFTHAFPTAGTYYYHCSVHPQQMMGQIVAAQAATPSPTPAATATPGATQPAATPTAGASLPSTGGETGGHATSTWAYVLVALGTLLLVAGGSVAFAWRRSG